MGERHGPSRTAFGSAFLWRSNALVVFPAQAPAAGQCHCSIRVRFGGVRNLGAVSLTNKRPCTSGLVLVKVRLAATKHVGVAGYYKSGLEPPPEAAKLLYKASWM